MTKTKRYAEDDSPTYHTNEEARDILSRLCRDPVSGLSTDARETLASLVLQEWPHLIEPHLLRRRHVREADALRALLDGTVTRPMDETCRLVLEATKTLPEGIRHNIRRSLAGAKDRKSLIVSISEYESQLRIGDKHEARDDAEKELLGRRKAGDE